MAAAKEMSVDAAVAAVLPEQKMELKAFLSGKVIFA